VRKTEKGGQTREFVQRLSEKKGKKEGSLEGRRGGFEEKKN